MRDIFIRTTSPLRAIFPLVRKLRQWTWKFHNRSAVRLVINGGPVKLMDAELMFPENVGLHYSTPLFWDGPDAYELPTSRTIALLTGRSAVFLDVGSNIGIYSVYAGLKYPEVKTFAFEPVPKIWNKNREFHQANRLSDSVVHNIALSDEEGEQFIYLPVYSNAWEEEQTGTLCQNSWQTREEKVEKIKIKTTTLDAFTAKTPLPEGFCCLKIDVENHEAAVFRGGRKFISSRRPWIVCEILPGQEIDPQSKARCNRNSEVATLIQELNYVSFAILDTGFFRMTTTDFDCDRTFKDFLLIPAEAVSPHDCYFSFDKLKSLVGTPARR